MERQFQKVPLEHGWEKFFNGNVCLSIEQEDYSHQCRWTISNWQAKTENMEPTWKTLMNDVELGEPTSSLDLVYLGCSQRECKISNEIVANCRDMFQPRSSAGAMEKNDRPELQGNLMHEQYLLVTWKVTQRNVWKDIANFRIKLRNNYTKSRHHARMTINLRKKKMDQLIINCLLTNCSDISIFDTYSEAWCFAICDETCSCSDEMDKIL